MNNIETPYFVIKKNELDSNFENFVKAAALYFNGGFIIGYSYKTNSLPWIINYFKNKNCYAEVVSEDEYNLARLIDVKKNKVIYNGPCKSKESFIDALNKGCYVNIDSKREIDWLDYIDNSREYNLGIRVNFNIESDCPNQSQCGEDGGRFGFCYENGELYKAIELIRKKGFNISGLHMHCSSKTRSLDIYQSISKYACYIAKEYNLNLKFIDVGGGFFGGLTDKPQFSDYFKLIANTLSKFFDINKLTIILEPGISLIGAPISFVTSVIDVKDTSFNRFVVIDGSRINIDPLMTKRNYFYDINADKSNIISKQIISGFTCMEHDRLLNLINEKELTIGDKIVFNNVGAYTMCLSPLFIKYFPDVYLLENDNMIKVRNRWTEKDYFMESVNNEYFDIKCRN